MRGALAAGPLELFVASLTRKPWQNRYSMTNGGRAVGSDQKQDPISLIGHDPVQSSTS